MLVDTAVWVDHLRRGDEALVGLLEQSQVAHRQLMGRGLGWIDMHLLAAASAAGERLMTRDRRLHEAARELGLT